MAAQVGSIDDDLTASDEVKSKPVPVESEASPSRDSAGESEPFVTNGRESDQPERQHQARPVSMISLSMSRQFSSGSLSAALGVNGKTCDVNLSEEKIVWTNKKGDEDSLWYGDIYAVVVGNPRKLSARDSSHSLHRPEAQEFTLYALRSVPGTPGLLKEVTFKCPTAEVCQNWSDQIYYRTQNFGNRPRRLFVVVSPVSGNGSAPKVWTKLEHRFRLARIHTDVLFTQKRYHAREVVQELNLDQYDGLIAVGGDGLFNELLNGLLLQTQNSAGVNLRKSRFIPVTAHTRIGIIPMGVCNSFARSVLGCQDPFIAAAQIMLGSSTPMDISSITQGGRLLMFSAGPLSYGFWSDAAASSNEFSWLGSRKFDAAAVKTLFAQRFFEAEISYLPMDDPQSPGLNHKQRCFGRCSLCSDFDSSLESPSATNSRGASVLASYADATERMDEREWRTVRGLFCSVVACPHVCCVHHAPHGLSPWGHLGDGCTDLILVTRCSKVQQFRWILRQRKGESQFELSQVRILRVKEFKFREILRPLMNDQSEYVEEMIDEDELTNNRLGGGGAHAAEACDLREMLEPASHWSIDGDLLNCNDIEVRVHRHLVTAFARGIEPVDADDAFEATERNLDSTPERADTEELLPNS
eukprot:Em0001g1824a